MSTATRPTPAERLLSTTTDKGELFQMPNGARVYYKDEDHSYWRCKEDGGRGRRLTGISTVVKPYDWEPDGLMSWTERLTLEGVVRGFAGETVPNDPHVLRQVLENRGLRWEQIRDEAGQRGTDVHMAMLEALAGGEDIPDLSTLPEDQRGYGQAVLKWWYERKPEPLQWEQVVVDDELGIAGRFDLLCSVGEETWLIDLKTGGFISKAAHVQLVGYGRCAQTCGFVDRPVDRLVILQVDEHGGKRELPCRATDEDFENAVKVYRGAGTINRLAGKDREAAA